MANRTAAMVRASYVREEIKDGHKMLAKNFENLFIVKSNKDAENCMKR